MALSTIGDNYFAGGRNIVPDPDANKELADLINEMIAQINANESAVGSVGTDDVSNDSGVAGATATAALDQLATDIGALGSDDIANDSGVTGATASAALDTLDARAGTIVDDESLAVAATVTEHRFTATADGVIERFGAKAETAAAAGESCAVDVQINGTTALTAPVTLDDTAGTNYTAGTVDAAANTFTAGDVITVVKTYTAGGTPTPMTDISAPIQARLT